MENLLIQNHHCVIPTERSDEGSLASARDDKQTAQTSYTDVLRDTQQAEFPLLSEVASPFVDDPLSLMNSICDEEGTVVPCALPDAMIRCLPQMMSETLSLYDDADIRTMQLAALMPTLGSAMSHVRVRHGQRLYSLGIMSLCVGPSASGKGCVGDVAGLVDGINRIITQESVQASADYRKRHKRYSRLTSQLNFAAKGDIEHLVDINDIASEVDEPQEPLRRMHKLPSKTTAANLYRLIYANGENISYLHIPELAEMSAANRSSFGDFMYIFLAAHGEEDLHTGRKTDDEDYYIEHTRLALVATGTMSSVREFIPNLEDGLSTRFLYHNLPAKSTFRKEMDEATVEAFLDVYSHHRHVLTEIWSELRQFDGKEEEELPRLFISNAQRDYIDRYYEQMLSLVLIAMADRGDLRAPILRSRLNLYRMLMIIAILRRHETLGGAEGMFAEQRFTTAEAIRMGEELGLKKSAVAKKLAKLTKEYYIGKVGHGVFVKTTKTERDKWKNKITSLAA